MTYALCDGLALVGGRIRMPCMNHGDTPPNTLSEGIMRVVGTPGDDVNAWGILKNVHGKWIRQAYADAFGTHLNDWPLAELSVDTVRERWGGGTYHVRWFSHDPDNSEPGQRFRACGRGPQFKLDDPDPPTRVASPAPAPQPTGFDTAMQMMAVINSQTSAQLAGVVQLAAAIGGGSRGDNETLRLLLDNQQVRFEALLERTQNEHLRTVEALRRELAEVRGILDEEEDETTVADVAGAVAQVVPRVKHKPGSPIGETFKTSLATWFADDPKAAVAQVIEFVKTAPDSLGKLVQEAQRAQLQQQRLAAAAQATQAQAQPSRPRAVPVPAVVDAAPAFDPNAGFKAAANPPPRATG